MAFRTEWRLVAGLSGLVLLLALGSLLIGPAAIDPGAGLKALFGFGDATDVLIVQQLRLPRALLAGLIGATLALAGAALQGLLRNPLAAPDVLGAPGAAAFGAVLAIALGL